MKAGVYSSLCFVTMADTLHAFFQPLVYVIFRTVTLMGEVFDFREHLLRSECGDPIYEKQNQVLGKVNRESEIGLGTVKGSMSAV